MNIMETQETRLHGDRCCNPFSISPHKGRNLRPVSKNLQKSLQFIPGMKICSSCRKRKFEAIDVSSKSEVLNSSIDSQSEQSYVNDEYEAPEPSSKIASSRERELEQMLDKLKQKFSGLPLNDPLRIMILTIVPDSWSIAQTCREFNTSKYFVKKALKLKEIEGVMSTPIARAGKRLSQDVVESVRNFYECDENSRIMPNKKDIITVRLGKEKEKRQKRLMLCDIKYLHVRFKELNPQISIGLTKFAELRPPWCVLAGATGTHSVCVCIMHQNCKTMFDASNLARFTKNYDDSIQEYRNCFRFFLCNNPSPACYLRECQLCQEIDLLSDYLKNIFEEKCISKVIFSTWESTDRCTLKKECLSSEDFADDFCTRLNKLLTHDFISKTQSQFIINLKTNLEPGSVIIHTDFSENFAFVAQDAAQAFHYNNSQCTVHPVVCYYKNHGGETCHKSFVLLSDCTTHDTTAVYVMQKLVIPEIKKLYPNLKRIMYVSDGAKQHYKNKYQMCNLIHHEEDFGVKADWHFHATAHGKGACDGVGAILKREATRASLQAQPNDAILTPESLYQWANRKFKNLHVMYYDEKEHGKTKRFLNKRFSAAPKVDKISIGHAFIVLPGKILQIFQYSGSKKHINNVQY